MIGVMVTASHNPKNDNGYKVYGANGAQIISPVDKEIQEHILENLEPKAGVWNITELQCSEYLKDPLDAILAQYLDNIEDSLFCKHVALNAKTPLKFTYTAMHGVGYPYVVKVFQRAGLTVIPVEEQIEPDPEFPTVKYDTSRTLFTLVTTIQNYIVHTISNLRMYFGLSRTRPTGVWSKPSHSAFRNCRYPNPEEGKGALKLSMETAAKHCSNIIIANDPDADRLACAVMNKR